DAVLSDRNSDLKSASADHCTSRGKVFLSRTGTEGFRGANLTKINSPARGLNVYIGLDRTRIDCRASRKQGRKQAWQRYFPGCRSGNRGCSGGWISVYSFRPYTSYWFEPVQY